MKQYKCKLNTLPEGWIPGETWITVGNNDVFAYRGTFRLHDPPISPSDTTQYKKLCIQYRVDHTTVNFVPIDCVSLASEAEIREARGY